MVFQKSLTLGFNYSTFDKFLLKIYYCPNKKKLSCTKASLSSLASERPGSGGCDVTGRIQKFKTSEHNMDFSC